MDNIKKNMSLSMTDMLCEAYADTRIEKLQESYDLEISKYNLDMYPSYTPMQLLAHYNIEVELAQRLMNSSKTDRKTLYSTLYDELFRRVPYHPQLMKKHNPEIRLTQVHSVIKSLKRYLHPDTVFLELGPGDCQLSFEVAKIVRKVYAIDVSAEITKHNHLPDNFELIISDGSSVDVPESSVNVAYSNQLMEHLHPEDAVDQLTAIYQSLAPGGIYICTTPHRFGGPGDVSMFFNRTAKGFHLKEYTNYELYKLFKDAGFSRIYSSRRFANKLYNISPWPAMIIEHFIEIFPNQFHRRLYRHFLWLLSIRLIATK